ncbi:hypothetical protein L596_001964 [Steinernema carpocapsae]|uniref:Uncharacterized protein n=1 Tax=Steinernema carpocapsae TaxID=34508 RepID=A0A4U5PJN6_STECR|nr:hypothetical protein L596_027059 [Steinernema carpocapsae]TKR63246.1 hypothetical protein L596_027095 [Steinernema carpocapsae]TKR96858.1 hypothetical protein L596_010813 [Steinernema carpocapsae]TMS34342.1 hypothetical protein L596_001964 [Steinernema carpocapsae]
MVNAALLGQIVSHVLGGPHFGSHTTGGSDERGGDYDNADNAVPHYSAPDPIYSFPKFMCGFGSIEESYSKIETVHVTEELYQIILQSNAELKSIITQLNMPLTKKDVKKYKNTKYYHAVKHIYNQQETRTSRCCSIM